MPGLCRFLPTAARCVSNMGSYLVTCRNAASRTAVPAFSLPAAYFFPVAGIGLSGRAFGPAVSAFEVAQTSQRGQLQSVPSAALQTELEAFSTKRSLSDALTAELQGKHECHIFGKWKQIDQTFADDVHSTASQHSMLTGETTQKGVDELPFFTVTMHAMLREWKERRQRLGQRRRADYDLAPAPSGCRRF